MINLVSPTDAVKKFDFTEGCLVLVDKPLDWTSFDAVNKIKYAVGKKPHGKKWIKVGHAGTLDPKATGLLLIAIGKHTSKLQYLQGLNKTYTGTFTLGATTPSYDTETQANNFYPTDHITKELLKSTASAFIGNIEQVPPIFSAVKIEGKRAYSYARKGQDIEMKTRNITIKNFEIQSIRIPEVDFLVTCTKGTYIRSLANDFGKQLDCGAYLSALCRTAIGKYTLAEAWNLSNLIDAINTYKAKL